MEVYCVKCGTKAEKGQKLCHECGMRLISPEALLKLLTKADVEKKLSQMDVLSAAKRSEKAAKTEKTPIAEKKPIEKAEPVPIKAEVRKPSAEVKRVTPLFDNPTQPKRRSIFDDTPESKPPVRKESSGGAKSALDAQRKAKAPVNNPAVKLPEKKKTASQLQKREDRETRAVSQPFYMPKWDDTKTKPASPKKKPEAKRTNASEGLKRRSAQAPNPSEGMKRRSGQAGNASDGMKRRSGQSPNTPRKPAAPTRNAKPAVQRGSSGAKKVRPKREEESFVEKYLRSIISMMLLTCTVVMMLMWAYATDSGLRTMAQFGLGSQKGYILLGDDCMTNGNYRRAVEHYYKALSQKVNYEAGMKLAKAYRHTGEAEKETSALLLLMDRYEGMDEPYQRILELYPDPGIRPEKVQNAINMHER